eukprot:3353111-Prymnesium_polylepis.2
MGCVVSRTPLASACGQQRSSDLRGSSLITSRFGDMDENATTKCKELAARLQCCDNSGLLRSSLACR